MYNLEIDESEVDNFSKSLKITDSRREHLLHIADLCEITMTLAGLESCAWMIKLCLLSCKNLNEVVFISFFLGHLSSTRKSRKELKTINPQ